MSLVDGLASGASLSHLQGQGLQAVQMQPPAQWPSLSKLLMEVTNRFPLLAYETDLGWSDVWPCFCSDAISSVVDLGKSTSRGFIGLEILLKLPANRGVASLWVVAFLYFRTVIMSMDVDPLHCPPLQPQKRFCCRTGGSSKCPLLSVTSTNHQQRNGEFGKLQIYSKKRKERKRKKTATNPWNSLCSFHLSQFYCGIVPWCTWGRRRSVLLGSECAARLVFVLSDTLKTTN